MLGLAGGLLAACGGSSSSAPPPSRDAAGSVISSTPIAGAPAGSQGWRITYRTTTASGAPAVSEGTVYASTAARPASGKRLVVAWAHPTLGMGADCSPSRASDPALGIPGFAEMMAKGWVVASTDYSGLGSKGTLPYLVSAGEARNVIDSVRAAEHIAAAEAGSTFAVWGHSQGGHASLATADFARSYAPELKLVGVAAAAPAAELSSLFDLQWQGTVAWVIGSEVISLWPRFYPELKPASIATSLAIEASPKLGATCITADESALLASFGPYLAKPFFSSNPTSSPTWRAKIVANTPSPARGVPVYVAQGLEDDVVLPSTTAQLQTSWCEQGSKVEIAWFPTATHFTVPSQAAPSAVGWLGDRFAGRPASSTCSVTPPVKAASNPPLPR